MRIKKFNLLDNINNLRLRRMGRKTDFKKDSYKFRKVDDNLSTQIEIDTINNENSKLKALFNNIKNKMENAKINIDLAKINRAIEFNKKIAENDTKEIKYTKKLAKKSKRHSLIASLISAFTTLIAVYNEYDTVYLETFALQTVAILEVCYLVNNQIINITKFYDKFFNRNNIVDKIIMSIKLMIIPVYTGYSIFTNFQFWEKYFDGIALVMFSLIFDMLSIENALEYNKYNALDYNEKYRKQINGEFEEEENKNKISDKSNVINLKKNSTKAV